MPASSGKRSASTGSSASSSSNHSQDTIDGELLHQLACVETLLPISHDITPTEEPAPSHPVARIDYSPNFRLVYGLYRTLRSSVDYTDAVAQQRGTGPARAVIRALHTSPARWLLLLGFALRQCTSNYTVWKDRRDVIMSPDILRCCTRDALPAASLPAVVLSADPEDARAKAKAMEEVAENRKRIEVVAGHWLPGPSDLYVPEDTASAKAMAAVSPWRAVRWELNAVGCFTRLYHKNFQVWHHRREMLSYALQHTKSPPTAAPTHSDPIIADTPTTTAIAAPAGVVDQSQSGVLESEEAFSAFLTQHHGIAFADVDERLVVKAVLCNVDSKNYHAWLHFTWYLHALPFLLKLPSWTSLKAFADSLVAAAAARAATSCSADQQRQKQSWVFRTHPNWAFVTSTVADADTPASLRPTLPPSPFTTEMDFTAQLIHVDCLNNSAWCHRYALFKEDLLRRLWQSQQQQHNSESFSEEEFQYVVHALCMVEADFALQWLCVDPTNESAYTHARSIALLYHTVAMRVALWCGVEGEGKDEHDHGALVLEKEGVLRYLRDSPLCPPVAGAAQDLCANSEDGTVAAVTPARGAVLRYMQRGPQGRLAWADYWESFAVLRHVQQVQHTTIRERVAELELQAARVLRGAAARERITLLSSLYERSSQCMLDNFHQLDTAQYLCLQPFLEETWLLHFTEPQRRLVRQTRPPEAYRDGLQPEWTSPLPWAREVQEASDESVAAYFLCCEAAALDMAKRLTILDPIRFKYWKYEAVTTMQRDYGGAL